jgi:hypothetical protein
MQVFVGLYKFNTQARQSSSLATRIDALTTAFESFMGYVNRHQQQVKFDQALRAVFLAPEYMFSRAIARLERKAGGAFGKAGREDHRLGDRRQMQQEETDKLQLTMERLSARYRNVLLIPGTAAWRKKLPRIGTPERELELLAYQKQLLEAAPIGTPPEEVCRGSVPAREPERWPVFPPSHPGRTMVPELAARKVHTPADKVGELSTAEYVARNTAFCCFNGQCLFTYNKIGDYYEVFHESRDGPDTVHIPAVEAGRFRIPGTLVDVGISVCFDQSLLVFTGAKFIPLQYTKDPVDIHVLLSACIMPDIGWANLKDRGYVLSCSSQDPCNRVLHQGVAGPEEALEQVGLVDVYLIDVA